jgi:hypothetical protein
MWLFDFKIFYLAGKSILSGSSPYLIEGFYSPIPLAIFFVPFSILPIKIAYIAYVLLTIYLLFRIVKINTFWVLLSFPVFFTILVGQIDLLIALSVYLLGPFSLPILLSKPQLAFVFIPWLIRSSNKKFFYLSILLSLVLLFLCFLIQPNWVHDWYSALPTVKDYSSRDSNLYWLIPSQYKVFFASFITPIVFIIGFFIDKKRNSWTILHLLAPISNIYSSSILFDWIGPIEVILSWFAIFFVGGRIHSGAPMFVIGVSIIICQTSHISKLVTEYSSKIINFYHKRT